MRLVALVCVIAAAALSVSAQPTRPPTAPPAPPASEQTAATAAPASTSAPAKAVIASDPLKVSALRSNQSIDATAANRYLIVSGRGEYTIWANLAQIFVSVEPRIIQAVAGTNATQQSESTIAPDAKAKDEIKKVYERVIGVLEKYKAISISSPPSFVSSPMFEPNVTAFKMFMEHQRQMMMRRRKALAQRMSHNLLLQGRPLSMHDKAFVPSPLMSSRQAGLMHRSSIRNTNAIRNTQFDEGVEQASPQKPTTPPAAPATQPATPPTPPAKPEDARKDAAPVKPEAEKKDATAKLEKDQKNAKDEEPLVPLPDPKSLINFKGFRFFRPLSAVVPIESVTEIAHSLRAVNATIESVQLALSPRAFDEARAIASKSAIERALAVADAALGAAGEKRVKLETVLLNSSNEPHLPRVPMFRAAFLRPQAVPVVSQVILRVSF